ncbi:PO113 protein, partial [Rhipidura dahli]|nr:PO113 protein [Rhipidura dahli]
VIFLHYMDDILVCAYSPSQLDIALKELIITLENHSFIIQKEKVQTTTPIKYLGLIVTERTITPQKIKIKDNLKTLREIHQ